MMKLYAGGNSPSRETLSDGVLSFNFWPIQHLVTLELLVKQVIMANVNKNIDTTLFQSADLCIVGAICRDVKTVPLPAGDYLFHDGETSIGGIQETIGGGGANSAGVAAHLGAAVRFASTVGEDRLGTQLLEALEKCGVRCFAPRLPGIQTGTTVNLVYTSGQRHFLSCHPNNAALAFEHIDLAALSGAKHLLRADIWFSESMLFGGNEQLFREARRLGLATSIDLNWDPQWGHAPAQEIARRKAAARKALSLVDLAHGNRRELCAVTDALDLDTALHRLAEDGVKAVVVHLGEQGAGYFTDGKLVTVPPVPARQRVMATGTGDVLSVCMMLLHHRAEIPVEQRLRLANSVVTEFIEGRRVLIPTLV